MSDAELKRMVKEIIAIGKLLLEAETPNTLKTRGSEEQERVTDRNEQSHPTRAKTGKHND
jgi:hypothetical protein